MSSNPDLRNKKVAIFATEFNNDSTYIGSCEVQEDGYIVGAIDKQHAAGFIEYLYKPSFNFAFSGAEVETPKTKTVADIVSPDAPMTTNENGGSQSQVDVRFDLIDAKAMFEMAKVLDHGAKKYGANNWRKIPVDDHLNHLLMHTFAYLAGDATDDHLSHILCRATFALGVKLSDNE